MNTALIGYALPSWQWVPPVLRSAPYWRQVGRFAAWGPLIGGAPYVWLVFPLPFAYAIGLGPAVLAGMLFAAWLLAPGRRRPSAGWRAAVAMLCGALACGVAALVFDAQHPLVPWLFLAAHGVPAALVLSLRPTRASAAVGEPWLPYPAPSDAKQLPQPQNRTA